MKASSAGRLQSFFCARYASFLVLPALVLVVSWARSSATNAKEPESRTTVRVAPKARFSISVSDNPSTGYTLALGTLSRGIFFLGIEDSPPGREQLPGAASKRKYQFFNSLESSDEPIEVTFARFQEWDFDQTYTEEIYVLEIKPLPSLGAELEPAGKTVKVVAIEAKGLAQRLGFKRGDVVAEINGTPIATVEDVAPALANSKDQVTVRVLRQDARGKEKAVNLKTPWPAE